MSWQAVFVRFLGRLMLGCLMAYHASQLDTPASAQSKRLPGKEQAAPAAQFKFFDRNGNRSTAKIDLGDKKKRFFIAGATLSAAQWHYLGLAAEDFPQGITLRIDATLARANFEEARA